MALASILLLALSGCSVSGEGKGDCALRLIFQQTSYDPIANVPFTTGRTLGPGTLPGCDGGEESDATDTTVYAVKGLDSDVAVAANTRGQQPSLFVVMKKGKVPEEVQTLIDQARTSTPSAT
jgi:hypothetical protein